MLLKCFGIVPKSLLVLVVGDQLLSEEDQLLRPERAETATGAMECVLTTPAALRLVGAERAPCTARVVPRLLHQALVAVEAPVMAVAPIRNCVAPSLDGVARPLPIAVGAIFASPIRLW